MKCARGFTMVELILVMVLIGVLAAIGVPRLMGDNAVDAAVFGDQVTSALRTAQKTAVARRRLVCAKVSSNSVTLSMAVATPATTCGTALNSETYATSAAGVTATPLILYFQPNGNITSDAAGSAAASGTVAVSLAGTVRRSIAYEGTTGYVE